MLENGWRFFVTQLQGLQLCKHDPVIGCSLRPYNKTKPDDLEKHKSFEIFRRNSRDVEIITFDELLEKLKLLHTLLSTNEIEEI